MRVEAMTERKIFRTKNFYSCEVYRCWTEQAVQNGNKIKRKRRKEKDLKRPDKISALVEMWGGWSDPFVIDTPI